MSSILPLHLITFLVTVTSSDNVSFTENNLDYNLRHHCDDILYVYQTIQNQGQRKSCQSPNFAKFQHYQCQHRYLLNTQSLSSFRCCNSTYQFPTLIQPITLIVIFLVRKKKTKLERRQAFESGVIVRMKSCYVLQLPGSSLKSNMTKNFGINTLQYLHIIIAVLNQLEYSASGQSILQEDESMAHKLCVKPRVNLTFSSGSLYD